MATHLFAQTASPRSEVLCSGAEEACLLATPGPSCPIVDLDFDLAGPPSQEWRVIKSSDRLRPEFKQSRYNQSPKIKCCGFVMWTFTGDGAEMTKHHPFKSPGLSPGRIKGVLTSTSGAVYQIPAQR